MAASNPIADAIASLFGSGQPQIPPALLPIIQRLAGSAQPDDPSRGYAPLKTLADSTQPAPDADQVANEMTNVPADQGGESADQNMAVRQSVSDDPNTPPVPGDTSTDTSAAPVSRAKKELGAQLAADQALMKKYGFDDINFKTISEIGDPVERHREMQAYVQQNPPDRRISYSMADRQKFAAEFPGYESRFLNAPDSEVGPLYLQLAGQQDKVPKQDTFDYSSYDAQTQAALKNMTPEQRGAYVAKQLENRQSQDSGDVYPRLKGHDLKIVNDADFQRLGLKSGQKVCITIP